jgi:hypothetical protein
MKERVDSVQRPFHGARGRLPPVCGPHSSIRRVSLERPSRNSTARQGVYLYVPASSQLDPSASTVVVAGQSYEYDLDANVTKQTNTFVWNTAAGVNTYTYD